MLLGAGGWIYLQDSPDAEILEPSVEARLLGKSGADILLVRNAVAYEVKRGLQVAPRDGLCEIVWHRSQSATQGPTELVIDADFERTPPGTAWGVVCGMGACVLHYLYIAYWFRKKRTAIA